MNLRYVSLCGRIIFLSTALGLLSGCQLQEIQPNLIPTSRAMIGDPKQAVPTPQEQTTAQLPAEDSFFPDLPGDKEPNILDRLRKLFAFDIKDNYQITVERKRYLRHPHQLRKIQQRAKPYLYYILNEIERRKLPGELALLPIVESEYKIHARSSSRAMGLWQFMPSTGRMYGLKQNWWYDGRKDVAASTHAALKYLSILNRKFKKDWALALAAYNAGDRTIRRAQKKNLLAGKPTNYWSLKLPRETKRYIPKLYALAQIFANPRKYGLRLLPIEDKPQIALVKTNSQIDLGLAAELTNTDIGTIKRLNPSHKQWATDPKGPHRIILPVDKANHFIDKLVDLPAEKRIHLRRHRILKGESLLSIAATYGSNVESIRKANRFSGNKIRAGRSILVPAPYGKKGLDMIAATSISQRQSAPKVEPSPKTKVQAPKSSVAAEPKPKETALSKMAKRFKVFLAKEM